MELYTVTMPVQDPCAEVTECVLETRCHAPANDDAQLLSPCRGILMCHPTLDTICNSISRCLYASLLVCCPANNWLNSVWIFVSGKARRRVIAGLWRGAATPPGAKRRDELSQLLAGQHTRSGVHDPLRRRRARHERVTGPAQGIHVQGNRTGDTDSVMPGPRSMARTCGTLPMPRCPSVSPRICVSSIYRCRTGRTRDRDRRWSWHGCSRRRCRQVSIDVATSRQLL